jgi:hypothetical protein
MGTKVRLPTIATAFRALLLLVRVALATSWALSKFRYHYVTVNLSNGALVSFQASGGVISGSWIDAAASRAGEIRVYHGMSPATLLLMPVTFWTAHGFSRSFHAHSAAVYFPHWIALTLAIMPVAVPFCVRQFRRHRRRRRRLCIQCGYDLRGVPGRCPECGHPAGCAIG